MTGVSFLPSYAFGSVSYRIFLSVCIICIYKGSRVVSINFFMYVSILIEDRVELNSDFLL